MKLGGRRISDGEVGNKVVNYDTVRNVGRSITYEAFDKQKLKKKVELLQNLCVI